MEPSWAERRATAAEADGEEWDRLNQAFDQAWRERYTQAFVEHAVSRGWKREDAATWPPEIAEEALCGAAHRFEFDPVQTAEWDVREVEIECANAA